MKIGQLFYIEHPKRLVRSECTEDINGINFVSSQAGNNGVAAKVSPVLGTKIYPKGVITVPLKGSVLAAHVQTEPCYVAHEIAVLTPKEPMSIQEKLFYCACIQRNAYRYNYGRQADRTLADIELTVLIPPWVYGANCQLPPTKTSQPPELKISEWGTFRVGDIFDITSGKGITTADIEENPGDLPVVQSGENNNGIIGEIDRAYCEKNGFLISDGPCFTVAGTGSAGCVTYQKQSCVIGGSAKRLALKDKTQKSDGVFLFLQTILSRLQYKYSYGRKATNQKYLSEVIKLPVTQTGQIDYQFMEDYIKCLAYGDFILPEAAPCAA